MKTDFNKKLHKMNFDKNGNEITVEEVIEKCQIELKHYCGKFYAMGNDRQVAEDYCYKISSFLDYVNYQKDEDYCYTDSVKVLNLCFKNLYHARELYKAFKILDFADDSFESVYG